MWWDAQCLSLMWHLLVGFWIDFQKIWMLVSWFQSIPDKDIKLCFSGYQDTIPCWGLWAVLLPDTGSGFDDLLLLSLDHICFSDHHCLCGWSWLDYAIWGQGDQKARQPAKGDNHLTQKIEMKIQILGTCHSPHNILHVWSCHNQGFPERRIFQTTVRLKNSDKLGISLSN